MPALIAAALMVASSCPIVAMTPALRRSEAAHVTAVAHAQVLPLRVDYILAQGPWRLVWATPEDRERGVYFFRSGRLVDTWGGVLAPDERQSAIGWATGAPRRVPTALARCFADAVLAGR